MSPYHFGVFSSDRRPLAASLQSQRNLTTTATELQIRYFTHACEKKKNGGLFEESASMGTTEVDHLIQNIVRAPEAELLDHSVGRETDDILTNSG